MALLYFKRPLIPVELLHRARMEWSIESMCRMLDVYVEEDRYKVEDKTIQSRLIIFRKAAIFQYNFLFRSNMEKEL